MNEHSVAYEITLNYLEQLNFFERNKMASPHKEWLALLFFLLEMFDRILTKFDSYLIRLDFERHVLASQIPELI